MQQVLTQAPRPCACIVSERDGHYSRDAGRIAASQSFTANTVLGATLDVTKVATTITQAAGNAGDGAVTLDPTVPVRGDAKDGTYTVEFLTAGATAEFHLLDPERKVVGDGAVGTAFTGPLKFTIADDAAKHYAAGDRVFIGVAFPVSAILYEALNLAATDGSQVAVAVALYPATTAAGQTARIAVLLREAEVRGTDLVWPAAATPAQIAEGVQQLRRRGLIIR